jgi:hypothetical protein
LTAGGEHHPVQASGNSIVKTSAGEIKLTNVKYVPTLTKNLILVGAVADSSNCSIKRFPRKIQENYLSGDSLKGKVT